MQRNMIKFLMPTLLLMSFNLMAAGDVDKGQSLSLTCAACHGMDGNSVNPIWPSIAGQHEAYLDRQIKLFRDGERENALMAPMVASLSDQDIADLSAYFSAQKLTMKAANPEMVELGRKIYQGGDKERNIPACMSCHGPTGTGNPLSGYPILANQHAAYSAIQLRAYKAGLTVQNDDDVNGQVMADVARYMTEEEIDAVASYVQGLKATQ
ncbi:Cytochrome c4 [hydrothermal vent metagenome]|uniref:Cytochrome c4 n=1 Tax=hydrothermal vent metagenome TaxID=652676 RepID=A0A3B0W8F3_9ZZZZ